MRPLRHFTAPLAALALALAGLAPPSAARADAEDALAFILGTAAFAVILDSFDDRAGAHGRYTGHVLPAHCRETYRARGRTIEAYHARCLRRAGLRDLPGICRVDVNTRHGSRSAYTATCLERRGYRPELARHDSYDRHDRHDRYDRHPRLPHDCAVTYRRGHDRFAGYDGHCWQRRGSRLPPESCILYGRDDHGPRTVYDARCLRRHGFRVD